MDRRRLLRQKAADVWFPNKEERAMDKKQADRRPGEKPAAQGQGKNEPTKPESGPRMPEAPEGNKRFGQTEGDSGDKQAPKPGARGGERGILDGGDRSDRESGRPIQLEDDDEREAFPPGQERKPSEPEKTKR
jgi:hypothetical protein